MLSNIRIVFGTKKKVCIEAYMHTPISKEEKIDPLFGIEDVGILNVYNIGLMIGVVLGEF